MESHLTVKRILDSAPLPEATVKQLKKAYRYWRWMTSPCRVNPDFLIIGAQRSGSSSLYYDLTKHPDVVPALTKEVHYFDMNTHMGRYWYRSHFMSIMVKRCMERSRGRTILTGEASPYYIFHPRVPLRVRNLLPNVKLIAILRNPVDRAFSHYQHEVRRGRELFSFEEAIELEEQRTSTHTYQLLADDLNFSEVHRDFSYLERGRYVEQLERWLWFFGRRSIHILCSEDYFANPQREYARLLRFLGLRRFEQPRFTRHYQANYTGMNPETRLRLQKYFAPYNKRLYDIVGRDFGWEK